MGNLPARMAPHRPVPHRRMWSSFRQDIPRSRGNSPRHPARGPVERQRRKRNLVWRAHVPPSQAGVLAAPEEGHPARVDSGQAERDRLLDAPEVWARGPLRRVERIRQLAWFRSLVLPRRRVAGRSSGGVGRDHPPDAVHSRWTRALDWHPQGVQPFPRPVHRRPAGRVGRRRRTNPGQQELHLHDAPGRQRSGRRSCSGPTHLGRTGVPAGIPSHFRELRRSRAFRLQPCRPRRSLPRQAQAYEPTVPRHRLQREPDERGRHPRRGRCRLPDRRDRPIHVEHGRTGDGNPRSLRARREHRPHHRIPRSGGCPASHVGSRPDRHRHPAGIRNEGRRDDVAPPGA